MHAITSERSIPSGFTEEYIPLIVKQPRGPGEVRWWHSEMGHPCKHLIILTNVLAFWTHIPWFQLSWGGWVRWVSKPVKRTALMSCGIAEWFSCVWDWTWRAMNWLIQAWLSVYSYLHLSGWYRVRLNLCFLFHCVSYSLFWGTLSVLVTDATFCKYIH